MKKSFLLALLLSLICLSPRGLGREKKGRDDFLKKFHQALKKVQNYSLVSRVYMGRPLPKSQREKEKPTTTSQIWGLPAQKLAIHFQIGDKVKGKMIFDGTWQWIERTYLKNNQTLARTVVKVKLSQVTTSRRPFHTYYRLSGVGIFMGEDYLSTQKLILQLYQLTPRGKEKVGGEICRVYEGRIINESLKKYLHLLHQAPTEKDFEFIRQSMERIRLYISSTDYMCKAYVMGSNLKKPNQSVLFSQIQINSTLPAKTFQYSPPKGEKAHNVTGYVQAQMELERESFRKMKKSYEEEKSKRKKQR